MITYLHVLHFSYRSVAEHFAENVDKYMKSEYVSEKYSSWEYEIEKLTTKYGKKKCIISFARTENSNKVKKLFSKH